MDKPLITTGVDITLDNKSTLNMVAIIVGIAILIGVVVHFTFKALGR